MTPSDAASTGAGASAATGADSGWVTWDTLIRPSKYADSFPHYDYVNPDAPKGGTLNQVAIGSFDSFNPFIVRGTAAAGMSAGNGGFGGGLIYETLTEQSTDEPGVSYGLIAEAMKFPEDDSWVKFRINPNARWHDGEPITADDVIWSFDTLRELHPQWNAYYRNVVKAEKTGEREVTFTFDQKGNRELPHIMGDLVVVPRHWWEGTDASGKKRDITQPTLEPPLGSALYKIDSFSTGSSIIWARVPDAWSKDLPQNVGRHNFDRMKFVYLRDSNASWEAFKKGGLDDWRVENISRRWAEGYDFPAAQNGQVIKKEIHSPSVESMQAYVLNNRLPKFQDRRVRQALTLAFNFEEMNRTLFYNSYKRITSYFANSELAATGLPSEGELKFLEPLRGQIPDEVFTKEFTLPVYDDAAATREHLRQALDLFKQAGYELKGTSLVNAKTGEPFTIEFLGDDPTDSRTLEPFARQLQRLGIKTNIRIIDTNQYVERMTNFDFEVMAAKYYPQSLSPGNEQRDFWSSKAADSPGSRNYAGIKSPVIDKLVDTIVYADNRDDLVAATRALDRVMLWEYYVVPQWYKDTIWLAYWNKFGMPETAPEYAGIDPYSWWIKDAASGGTPQ
ncbi:extracellular solute-binding protein [Consotaella salsifontis]|uniref:extracellular solute-binding protein n=1 Tax=Consotaella salsifontis TaxID=1365950 RepID=UPI00099A2AAE